MSKRSLFVACSVHRGVARGLEYANEPLGKIFEIDREYPLHRKNIFEIDRENPGFREKRPFKILATPLVLFVKLCQSYFSSIVKSLFSLSKMFIFLHQTKAFRDFVFSKPGFLWSISRIFLVDRFHFFPCTSRKQVKEPRTNWSEHLAPW
jgi:hypothetical protein